MRVSTQEYLLLNTLEYPRMRTLSKNEYVYEANSLLIPVYHCNYVTSLSWSKESVLKLSSNFVLVEHWFHYSGSGSARVRYWVAEKVNIREYYPVRESSRSYNSKTSTQKLSMDLQVSIDIYTGIITCNDRNKKYDIVNRSNSKVYLTFNLLREV